MGIFVALRVLTGAAPGGVDERQSDDRADGAP